MDGSPVHHSRGQSRPTAVPVAVDVREKHSLAAIVRDAGGPLSLADAVDLALDVCDELANAHANGIVHGTSGSIGSARCGRASRVSGSTSSR